MRLVTAVALFACSIFSNPVSAQTANDLINIFGGLVRTGITAAAQSSWERLPPTEIRCVDQRLRERGSSINAIIQQGINSADSRISCDRAACRISGYAQSGNSFRPSFDCSRATYADENSICTNAELSQLDNVIATDFTYIRDRLGGDVARSVSNPSLQSRHSCGADVNCIKDVQLSSIAEYQKLGAPSTYQVTSSVLAQPSLHAEYVVDGLALGAHVQFSSQAYRDYHYY